MNQKSATAQLWLWKNPPKLCSTGIGSPSFPLASAHTEEDNFDTAKEGKFLNACAGYLGYLFQKVG